MKVLLGAIAYVSLSLLLAVIINAAGWYVLGGGLNLFRVLEIEGRCLLLNQCDTELDPKGW
jgi:hypothetical protein